MSISRTKSYIIITLVYLLASIVGCLVYLLCPFELWLSLLLADVAATALTFVFSLIFKNASVYDPYWSVAPMVILIALALKEGFSLAGLVVILTVLIWGVRLTANWAYTFGGMSCQDWRYTMLEGKCGALYPIVNFLGIHLFPTLVVYLCILPAALVVTSDAAFSPLSLIGALISLIAALLQGVSDFEMHKYRKERKTPFRHPNYLGEILMWWGVALYSAFTLGASAICFVGAVLNTLMFLFVSIPLSEGRQAAKEGFADYKRRTRMLLPFKK